MGKQNETATLDADRLARITVEPYPHEVSISAHGVEIAHTTDALLFRGGYAPDIYVPAKDVRRELLMPSGTLDSPSKQARADLFDARLAGQTVEDIAWSYPAPVRWPGIAGRIAFEFDKVRIEVDGQLVRGHVRDPLKTLTVAELGQRLTLELGGQTVADTARALVLRESGLPDRFYIPAGDVDRACLEPSDRRTVCTYKGEATYWHLKVAGQRFENAVWAYPEPWTDFAADIGRIAGYLGFYASHFDRVLLDGQNIASAADKAADSAMIASPTIDSVMRERA